jgi:hypothetical protein
MGGELQDPIFSDRGHKIIAKVAKLFFQYFFETRVAR